MRHFAMPDDHTVLPGVSGQALTQLTERPASEQIAAKPWFELWQAVEQHMLAVVIDNSSGDWNGPWDDTDLPEAKTLATHTKFFALGCDLQGDKLNVVLIVECAESHKTDQVVQSLQGLLAWSIREAEKANANQTHDADFLRRLYISVLKELETSKPEADAARVSLKVSVDAESSAIAALAANLASHLPTSTPSATASK
jgi:hypothetical protein